MNTTQIIIIFIAALLFLVAAAFILRFLIKTYYDRSTAAYQNKLMKNQIEEVNNVYMTMRGWRHDYHNHIQTMKAYLTMGQLEDLNRYFQELDQDLTTVDTVIKTGNVMIDAILNSKLSLAKDKNIRIEAKAIVPPDLQISEVDLSLIIGNLLDNAMEACMKMKEEEEKFIRVYIDILKGQLYIYVMNSVGEAPKRVGRIYLTTKDKKFHGLGLIRMDQVVQKYHGYLDRQNEDGVFATEVMLPL